MEQWAIGPVFLWLMKLAGPPRSQVVAPASGAIPRLEEEGREGEQWEERGSFPCSGSRSGKRLCTVSAPHTHRGTEAGRWAVTGLL